jgi:hypothetical protein
MLSFDAALGLLCSLLSLLTVENPNQWDSAASSVLTLTQGGGLRKMEESGSIWEEW